MDPIVGLLWATSLGYVLYRFLRVAEDTEEPQLLHTNPPSEHIKHVITGCPILKEKYEPPRLWGKNGHLQTVLSSKFPGRFKPTRPVGDHLYLTVSDGATFSFDLYQPIEKLFEGCTEEIRTLVLWILRTYPSTKLIGIGYSMGANILVKFLGEDAANQSSFLCCVSIQQGYELDLALRDLSMNSALFRVYNFLVTKKYQQLLRHHYKALFGEKSKARGVSFWRILMATSLMEIDREFTCKFFGFSDVGHYYRDSSSSNFMKNITLPMLCLNSVDDPVCPEELLRTPTKLAAEKEQFLFVKTKHGGHLAYFEGGLVIPNTVTWCDRLILQYSNAIRTNETINVVHIDSLGKIEL